MSAQAVGPVPALWQCLDMLRGGKSEQEVGRLMFSALCAHGTMKHLAWHMLTRMIGGGAPLR